MNNDIQIEQSQDQIQSIYAFINLAKALPFRNKKALETFLKDAQFLVEVHYGKVHKHLDSLSISSFLPRSFFASSYEYKKAWYDGLNTVLNILYSILKRLGETPQEEEFIVDDVELPSQTFEMNYRMKLSEEEYSSRMKFGETPDLTNQHHQTIVDKMNSLVRTVFKK